jgi:hypothetical protein
MRPASDLADSLKRWPALVPEPAQLNYARSHSADNPIQRAFQDTLDSRRGANMFIVETHVLHTKRGLGAADLI